MKGDRVMICKTVRWANLKEAQKFTHILSQYPIEADLIQGRREVDAKSFLGICSLNPEEKIVLHLYADRDTEHGKELIKQIEPYLE